MRRFIKAGLLAILPFAAGVLIDKEIQIQHHTWTEDQQTELAQKMRGYTVAVRSADDNAYGSGFTIITDEADYVITAAHILYTEDEVPPTEATIHPTVVERVVENVEVGFPIYTDNDALTKYTIVKAKVIKISHPERGYDLALLKLNTKTARVGATISSKWYHKIGENVFHCGMPKGISFMGYFSRGTLAGIDRPLADTPHKFDQITCPINKGSSGGPVADSKGEIIGVTSRMISENSGFIVPARVLAYWLKDYGYEFLYNREIPIPDLAELEKQGYLDKLSVEKKDDADDGEDKK